MTGKEKEFPCVYCGEPTTKSGSIHKAHYPCSDEMVKEWPVMKKAMELMAEVIEGEGLCPKYSKGLICDFNCYECIPKFYIEKAKAGDS